MSFKIERRWIVFIAMSLIYFWAVSGSFTSLGVVLPQMVTDLHWNWADAGLGFTLLAMSCGIASYFPSFTIRTFGLRGTLALGVLFLVLGFVCVAITSTVWPYWIGEVLIGVGFAFVSVVPGTHILTNLFAKPSAILGAYFTLGAMGGVVGPQIYRLTDAMTGDWRVFWYVYVIAGFISGIFVVLAVPKDKKGDNNQEDVISEFAAENNGNCSWTVRQALTTSQFYVIVLGYTAYLLVNATTHTFAVQHLMERGISNADAGLMLSIEAFVAASVSLIGGFLGKKISPKTLMMLSLLAASIGAWGLGEARDWSMMWLYILGVGIGYGLSLLSATMLLLEYYGKKSNLELFSIMCLLSTFASIGSFLGGWMRDVTGNFYWLMFIQAVFGVLVLLFVLLMKRPTLKKATVTIH